MKHILPLFVGLMLGSSSYAQTQFTNIPTVYINTHNNQPVIDKDIQINSLLTLKSEDESEVLVEDSITIKGRGNSTWKREKKPYSIKFYKKTNFMNMPAKAKKWVFLANHADKSLMRNAIALQIGQMMEFEFTPSFRYVDLVLNNKFLGNYLVTDQVEVDKNRVPVESQKDTVVSLPDLAGGYLIEIDGFAASELKWFTTKEGLKVTVKYPEDDAINDEQFNYILNFTQDFEDLLFSDNYTDPEKGYRSMVDETSLINWYIASELTANPDCFWSTYLYKKRDENKFYFGPMWDYDIAFNNDNRVYDTTKKLMKDAAFNPKNWIQRLLTDPWFVKAVDSRWKELVAGGLNQKIQNFINETEDLIQESQVKNYNTWKVINKKVYNEPVLFSTFAEYVDFLRNFVNNRIDFLNDSFANLTTSLPSEPFVAEDFYYMITNNNSKNALDVNPETKEIWLWNPLESNDDQNWIIKEITSGSFQIINKEYNMAMTQNGHGNSMILTKNNPTDKSQLWSIKEVGTGNMFGIISKENGFSVNNNGGSFANGNKAIVYTERITASKNQQWFIEKLKAITITSIDGTIKLNHKMAFSRGSNILNVKLDSVNKAIVSVYSVSGNLVYQQSLTDFETQINLSEIEKGIYIIKLDTPDGSNAIKIMK